MIGFAEFIGWVVIVLVATFTLVEITYRLVVWYSRRLGLYRDLWCALRVVRARRRAEREGVTEAEATEVEARYSLTCGTCGNPLESDERGIHCPVPTCKSNWRTIRPQEV